MSYLVAVYDFIHCPSQVLRYNWKSALQPGCYPSERSGIKWTEGIGPMPGHMRGAYIREKVPKEGAAPGNGGVPCGRCCVDLVGAARRRHLRLERARHNQFVGRALGGRDQRCARLLCLHLRLPCGCLLLQLRCEPIQVRVHLQSMRGHHLNAIFASGCSSCCLASFSRRTR